MSCYACKHLPLGSACPQCTPLVEFRGWERIMNGTAELGQIAPALRDLNTRLSEIEEYLSELRRGPQ